ncbi:MAG: lipid-A-disaccharide synthase N-terminal domain-containing protein, partial [Dechloromonas sp.]|nr:lipid-A-disaccharide synthase N-terminal domain-containing protein [Dechloromonas sp.]
MDKEALIWIIIGFGGQALFMMRFVVQWWSSEKEKRVVVPVAFWYFS